MIKSKHMQDSPSLSPLKIFLNQKWVKITLIGNVLIIIFIVVILIINATRVSTITLNIAPIDAKISLNGDSHYANGTYSITPGSYTIRISHDQLVTKELTVDVSPYHNVTVSAYLSNNNDFTFYEQRQNLKSFEKLREIASPNDNITIDHDKSAENFVSYYQHNYEIYDILPIMDFSPSEYGKTGGVRYETDTLKISDGRTLADCQKITCLHITDTSGKKRDLALSVITKFGFSPEAYQIIYEEVAYED